MRLLGAECRPGPAKGQSPRCAADYPGDTDDRKVGRVENGAARVG